MMLELLELLQLPLGLWRSSNFTAPFHDKFDSQTACLLSNLAADTDPVALLNAAQHGTPTCALP